MCAVSVDEVNQRPKILGLTAALFRKRCKPGKIREVIQTLSETMGCVIKTPSDVEEVYWYFELIKTKEKLNSVLHF